MSLYNKGSERGVTFIELLVTLVVLSVLASMALPYAEKTLRRGQEIQLKQSLREIRTALDQYHEDWLNGVIPKSEISASQDGYPRSLEALVEGADSAKPNGGKVRYLRRIPVDPFADQSRDVLDQWQIRGYQDDPDSTVWGGRDVYDVYSYSDQIALDGTKYSAW